MEGLLQPTHLFFILLIVLIIFGPGKLPDLGRGLGKGIREFKDAIKCGMDIPTEKPEEVIPGYSSFLLLVASAFDTSA